MENKMSGVQVGSYALGDKILSGGTYDKLKALGTLDASEATFHDVSILGTATFTNCDIVKMAITGEATVVDSRIDYVDVLGELTLRGHVTGGGIRVFGEIASEDTTCRILQFGSSSSFRLRRKRFRTLNVGTFYAETLENFFPIHLDGKQKFKVILNSGQIDASAALACERFMSFGPSNIPEINAEMIYIRPCVDVKIETILGSVVVIDEQFDDEQWLKGVSMDISVRDMQTQYRKDKVCIGSIEADEVIVNHVNCNVISGKRIVIGEHANVKKVEYMDSCEIHPNANVAEVIKI